MMNEFIKYISSSIPDLNQDTLSILKKLFSKIELKKGHLLLKQEQVCNNLYFIAEGISRSFSIKDDKEYTIWFGFKNNFITSFISFFSREPSYESIEMFTNGTLYQIHSTIFFDNRVSSVQIEDIIKYNTKILEISKEKKVHHIDLFQKMKVKQNNWFTYDGIDPNSKGHQKIYKKIKKVIQNPEL
ncbi:cyclic nucleotide-binding domain-containing protein [Aquimarina sp. 2201CG1-2-11]|uniref:cyclic nucleotide-binding domain-containing protein n=1 Tax=Aquimarina discodermiae TaxID=3231043 RepID=UPI0034621FBB